MQKTLIMKCTICNEERNDLTIMINADTHKTDYVCFACMGRDNYKSMPLDEVDKSLESFEKILSQFEGFLRDPDVLNMEVPEGLEALAWTPKKAYKMAMDEINMLKMRKIEIESQMPPGELLKKQLMEAIGKEDFEKAATIKDQMNKLLADQKEIEV